MSGILPELLSVSLPMTALILLLWLFSRFLGHRFTAKCRYVIWTIVLLRLCIPFGTLHFPSLVQISLTPETAASEETISTTFTYYPIDAEPPLREGVSYPVGDSVVVSVEDVAPEELDQTVTDSVKALMYDLELPEGVEIVTETETDAVPSSEPFSAAAAGTTDDTPSEPPTEAVQETVTTPEPFAETDAPEETADTAPMTVLLFVWLAGAVGYAGVKIVSYNRYTARLRKNAADAPPAIHRIHERLCRKYGIRRPPELQVSPDVHSPMLYGYFRPCVILPEMDLSDNQTVGILAHELTHYRRRDLWIKLACVLGCSLHWFNPAAHAAASRCYAEMELSCDETVLAGLDEEARRSYGNVMLDIVRRCRRKNLTLTTHFNPKKNAVRERFLNIMDTSKKKQGFAVVLAAAVLCSLAGMVFAYETEPPANTEGYIKINDRVSIRIGSGANAAYEDVTNRTEPQTETEETFQPVEELYERGGLRIPLLSSMVEHVTVPEQTETDTLIEFYHTAHYEKDPGSGYGWLFSIGRHTYAELVRDDVNPGGIQYFAASPDNCYFYYIARPTDVRCDVNDEVLSEEYTRFARLAPTVAKRTLLDNGLTPFGADDIPGIRLLETTETYPSPDYLARLEYSEAYGWLLRGEGAGANGIAIGDSTRNTEVWAEWVSASCCRLSVNGTVIDLFRTESGWTTEESAFEHSETNHMPYWLRKADFTEKKDIFRKAYFGALTTEEFLSMAVVQNYFTEQCDAFLEPFRTQKRATVHGNPDYVPDGATLPDTVTWDMLTITESSADGQDYLVTIPLGDEFHLNLNVTLADPASAENTAYFTLSDRQFRLTEPILAEEGDLREIIAGLAEADRTDYSAEIRIPGAADALLSISVEGEGTDLHDLRDVYCTGFTAHGQTLRFETPLDLWGIWSMHIFEAEDAVVLMRRYSEYSANTYVITPKYTYEYHPGVFSLVLYEENGTLRYRHSSAVLCDAASRSGDDLTASILGLATSRDNFLYECGDIDVNGGKLEFLAPDEHCTIGDRFDLDAMFEQDWKSEDFPTIDDLFVYNGERNGTMFDYPSPEESPLPELVSPAETTPAAVPTLPLTAYVPESFQTDSFYRLQETTGENTNAYMMGLTTANSAGETMSSTVFIPQLKADTPTVTQWNRELYEHIRDAYAFIPYNYRINAVNDYFVTVTYEEFTYAGVVSIPITFRENTRIDGKTTSLYRMEVYHYDTKADKFLTNEEYLLRLTDGRFDYESLLESLNEQEFNRVLNEPHANLLPGHEVGPFTMDDIYGILPSRLDENGFDVYLPKDGRYETIYQSSAPVAVHWREYQRFISDPGLEITYRLIRHGEGYRMLTYINDTRDLPLPDENQSTRYTGSKVFAVDGDMIDVQYRTSSGGYPCAEITYTNERGVRYTRTTAYHSIPGYTYYFKKYLEGTYTMDLLIENSESVQMAGASLVREILTAYRNREKPFETAPDYPRELEVPEMFKTIDIVDYYVETGLPALPHKFAVPLEDGWTMEIYWNITDACEMVAEKIHFHQ